MAGSAFDQRVELAKWRATAASLARMRGLAAGPGANITSSWSSGWPVARSTRTGSISAPVRLFRYPHDSSGHGGTIGTGALISFMSGARLTLCVSGSWQSVLLTTSSE